MQALAARVALHAGLWIIAFALLAAVSRRPIFAAALVASAHALLIAVSAAKRRILREPLLYADLALFSQALRHPRLYLPYFGLLRSAGVAALLLAVLAAGLLLEPLAAQSPLAWLALLVPAALLMLAGTALARPQLTETDSARFGLAGAMWLHALAERKPLPPLASPFLNIRSSGDEKPPIVAVQSESFFDARRLHPAVARGVLERFDQLAREADCGRLAVPVWGAYTMRSEFAFLSGIPQAELGIHRFNPYRRLARGGVATLASALRARGYRTLCLHPYPAGFFARDRVFPALGFDAFVDLAGFAGAERAGPYIADAEVTARICRALEEASGPLFIFAITMENHGPLHLERATAAEAQELYAAEPPPGFDDLTVYLRHLRHADDMIGTLAQALSRKPGLLCFYGDHVPGLPSIYRALDYHDSRTDYLIWNFRNRESRRADLPVERLGLRLLERAGLARAPA